MTYLETVALIRDVANTVNDTGTFIHGRRVDGSMSYDEHYPVILLEPFTVSIDVVKNVDSCAMSLGFMFKDAAENGAEEREVIIGEADVLCTKFIREIQNRKVDIASVVARPFYNIFAGVNSGYLLTFNLITKRSAC